MPINIYTVSNSLKEDGWKLLRLDWKWVCNNTKEAIKLAKDFIDS